MRDDGQPRITPARPDDHEALSAICLKTAASGADATGLYGDPGLPGVFWVLPYAIFEPEHAFTLRADDEVLGYVVGTRDGSSLLRRLDRDWWPVVRTRYAGYVAKTDEDRQAMARLRTPKPLDARLHDYPAHLHVNLLPAFRRGGWGRRLVETELAALASSGASAVHLGVSLSNAEVTAFYGKLGFRRLFETGTGIFMGRDL